MPNSGGSTWLHSPHSLAAWLVLKKEKMTEGLHLRIPYSRCHFKKPNIQISNTSNSILCFQTSHRAESARNHPNRATQRKSNESRIEIEDKSFEVLCFRVARFRRVVASSTAVVPTLYIGAYFSFEIVHHG